VYYVPVEHRIFQDIRIEFQTTEGLHIPFREQHDVHKTGASFSEKLQVVIMYIKLGVAILNRTFMTMHILEVY